MARALLSVSDKTGLVDFARALVEMGYELVSTGGTARALHAASLPVTPVANVTDFPEILDGRVKTLHPRIHGGILSTRSDDHQAELRDHDITPVDLVVVNLYPFRETVARGVSLDEALENIDIGGPSMLRAAAKNFPHVVVVVDPDDYSEVAAQLKDGVSQDARKRLAAKAFGHSAAYDAAIMRYLSEGGLQDEGGLELSKLADLRYGENPHQAASLWRVGNEHGPVIDADILHGKAMSYNNYHDADSAWALLSELPVPSAVAVKHGNPCGVASADDLLSAYTRARDADPVSIFGGIVAVNQSVDTDLAHALADIFLEIVLAPDFTDDALEILTRKKNIRLLRVKHPVSSAHLDLRRVRGGLLVQDFDTGTLDDCDLKVVTERDPDDDEWNDLRFAWAVCKHVKSNAIVLAKDETTTGIGAGQVSRIWAAEQAIEHAGRHARGSALASDAFFPFDDVVRTAAAAGITSVIAPGGSKRDPEVIAACNELGLAMVFTGMRHFRH